MELVVRSGGREERVEVTRSGAGYEVRLGERTVRVDHAPAGGVLASLVIDGRQAEVSVHHKGNGTYQVAARSAIHEVEVVDPLTWLALQAHGSVAASGRQRVNAYMPGRVVAVLVEVGQEVEAGQGLVVLEAMKMENEIQAESSGTVARIRVQPGDAVEGGAVLVEIE